jgi:hypothetical protein
MAVGNVTKVVAFQVVQVYFAWQAWYFVASDARRQSALALSMGGFGRKDVLHGSNRKVCKNNFKKSKNEKLKSEKVSKS